jgi:hypothetical protein
LHSSTTSFYQKALGSGRRSPLSAKKNGHGENQPIPRGTQDIAKQFRLAHLLQNIFCLAFALGARSFWLAWNGPGIPTYATLALGMIVAILPERMKLALFEGHLLVRRSYLPRSV